MSAERLREAARLLRERAEPAPSGPWGVIEGVTGRHGPVACVHGAPDEQGHVSAVALVPSDPAGDHVRAATYIATMDPLVGVAVADWLSLVVRLLDEGFDTNAETKAGLVVADAVLGGAR